MIKFDYLGDYSLREDDLLDQVYWFGYMDGAFEESTYKPIVLEEYFDIYNKGHEDGTLYRNEHLNFINGLKLCWIARLSISDFKNRCFGRNLSSYYERVYNSHYYDLVKGNNTCDFDKITKYLR